MTTTSLESIQLVSKKALGLKKKRASNGSINLGCDHGVLRIQFPSQLSQHVWGIKQKYLYLDLPDNEQNRLIAELIIKDIQLDIYEERFDTTFKRYLNTLAEHLPKSEIQEPNVLGKIVGKVLNRHTLSRLFEQYLDYKSNLLAKTTIEKRYRQHFAKAFSNCPQNLHDGLKIRSYLLEHYSQLSAKRMLSTIADMIEWAKLNRLLPSDFLNPYKQYSIEITPTSQQKIPKKIQELVDAGFIEEPDDDYCAFSAEEAMAIMKAFEERVCLNTRCGAPWDHVVKFLFWTGCRLGECAGLKWRDVSVDCSKIVFKHSFSCTLRELKGLKTERTGVRKRTFPCGLKLQNLLLSIRPENYSFDDYVFQNKHGEAVNFAVFHHHWVGVDNGKTQIAGVLPTLIREGKVSQYLTPYATRHTYINAQLDAKVRAADVAKLVGNSVITIRRHYESARRDGAEPIEI